MIMGLLDLNGEWFIPSNIPLKKYRSRHYDKWKERIFAVDVTSSVVQVHEVSLALHNRGQSQKLFVLGPVSPYVVRTSQISNAPSRYECVSTFKAEQSLPYGDSVRGGAQHFGFREQESRLVRLRQFWRRVHHNCAWKPHRRRALRPSQEYCIRRAQFRDNRTVSGGLSRWRLFYPNRGAGSLFEKGISRPISLAESLRRRPRTRSFFLYKYCILRQHRKLGKNVNVYLHLDMLSGSHLQRASRIQPEIPHNKGFKLLSLRENTLFTYFQRHFSRYRACLNLQSIEIIQVLTG